MNSQYLAEQLKSSPPVVETAAPPTKEEDTLGQIIDFKNLYAVKGRPGVYTLRSYPQKSGVIALCHFMSDEIIHTHQKNLTRLSDLAIHAFTIEGDPFIYGITKAFDNLSKLSDELVDSKSPAELMDVIAPNYDPYQFKDYHAKKILSWYRCIKAKIDAFLLENIRQRDAEDKAAAGKLPQTDIEK